MRERAGAILYSTERALEVALEAMQCLGGKIMVFSKPLMAYLDTDVLRCVIRHRLSNRTHFARRKIICCRCRNAGDSTDAYW